MKGFRIDIYRNASGDDHTNGGASSRVRQVTVNVIKCNGAWGALPADMQLAEPSEQAPAFALVARPRPLGRGTYYCLEPAHNPGEGRLGWMSGGNCAGATDPRWTKLTDGLQFLPVHDRSETTAQYSALSI